MLSPELIKASLAELDGRILAVFTVHDTIPTRWPFPVTSPVIPETAHALLHRRNIIECSGHPNGLIVGWSLRLRLSWMLVLILGQRNIADHPRGVWLFLFLLGFGAGALDAL
jgi:hypothetical protein